jgi:hypothetical protein
LSFSDKRPLHVVLTQQVSSHFRSDGRVHQAVQRADPFAAHGNAPSLYPKTLTAPAISKTLLMYDTSRHNQENRSRLLFGELQAFTPLYEYHQLGDDFASFNPEPVFVNA